MSVSEAPSCISVACVRSPQRGAVRILVALSFKLYNQYVYGGQKVLGEMDEARLSALQDFYVKEGLVKTKTPVKDLYTNQLRDFFQGQRNFAAHLIGSRRPLKRLTDEIDSLSSFVDKPSQKKLAALKGLVVEKDWLDFAHVYLGLTKGWLFVHVPVTYALVVLTVLHVVVVYAFSSGPW